MKKRKWCLPICLFGMLILLLSIGKPVTVSADEATDIVASGSDGNAEWELSSEGTLTISGSGCTPWKYGNSYFSDYSVTEVVIEEGITSIEHGTFNGCSTIQKISLPTSLESISYNVFEGCTALTSIEIPENVTSIDRLAFDNCSNLKEINVHEDNTRYKSIDGALYVDYNVENTDICLYKCPEGYEGVLDVPSNTTEIYEYYGAVAIKNCTKLTEVVIPANILDQIVINRLGDNFSGCDNLYSFSVSGESSDQDTTYEIVDGALYKVWNGQVTLLRYPSGLSECKLWDKCTRIYYDAFCGCHKLTEVDLPEGITSIYEYGFRNCINLKEIQLPSSLESLGYAVFDRCESLEEVIIPDNVTTIPNIFRCCYALKNVELGKNVTLIGGRAFEACSSLETVTMGANVTEIKSYAFYGASLKDVYYGGTENQWQTVVIGENENEALNNATIHYLGANVESISLDETTILNVGGGETLKITFSPENASYKAVSWETSDANIATVENGVVTAIAPGTVIITATSLDSGCTATCSVTVNEAPDVVYGDANNDGVVNTKDIIRLRRYFATKNPITGETAVELGVGADANGDGVVNTKDIIRLRRYFATKNPITGEASVVLGPNT